MEIRTKQRLIGCLVLLAILAIFLPLLFYNLYPSTSLFKPKAVVFVPLVPTITNKSVIQLQLRPSLSAKITAAGKIHSTFLSPPPAQSIPPKLPKPATSKLQPLLQMPVKTAPPEVWVIQVASFSNFNNAKRLLNQLRVKGLDVYSCQSKGKKTIIRVFVGPDINRNKIDQIQKELKQQFQLNGIIRKYVVL